MALFKIEKGLAASLATARPTTNEGWCYFTKDDGKFYIDIETGNDLTKRVCLNAAVADGAKKLINGNGQDITTTTNVPVYFKDGVPVPCDNLDAEGYLPLSAGEDNKLTGPLGLTEVMYGSSLPEEMFNGQLFFMEDKNIEDANYLPLSAGAENKLTGALGLTEGVMYNSTLPESGFNGQLFFLEDDSPALPTGGTAGQALIKNSATDGDASWKDIVALPKGGSASQILIKNSTTDGDASWGTNAPTASKLATARTIALTGDVTGSGSFDGSSNLSITTTVADNSHNHSNYLPLAGGIMTGPISFNGNGACQIRNGGNDLSPTVGGDLGNIVIDSWYGISFTTSCSSTYKNKTAIGFDCRNGIIRAASVYGAVYNDYAEYRLQEEEIKPGYCVASSDNGQVYKTTEKFQACDGIVSDTFGFAIGETDECKTPLAVAGRVLAYCEGDRYSYHSGDTVCAGPEGKVMKMTREEIKEWPDRIVGIVSEIPEYETWGTDNTPVNGRIWIKVR